LNMSEIKQYVKAASKRVYKNSKLAPVFTIKNSIMNFRLNSPAKEVCRLSPSSRQKLVKVQTKMYGASRLVFFKYLLLMAEMVDIL